MPEFRLRKTLMLMEEVCHESGPRATVPRRRAACPAVVENPFAGGCHPHIQLAMADLKPLGLALSRRLAEILGGAEGIDLGHINAAYVRSHFDAMEVRIPDAPRAREIVLVLA